MAEKKAVRPPVMVARIPALDGLRGILAVVVLTYHVRLVCGTNSFVLGLLATYAVNCFFIMSGLVLTKSYDGRYLNFLARRAVRLWPVYALCIGAGALIQHRLVPLPVLFWYPGYDVHAGMQTLLANPPACSLCGEALAMPFMPAIAWFGSGARYRPALILPFWVAAAYIPGPLHWLGWFMIGSALSRCNWSFLLLETRLPQWLGRLSYSLYLSHMPVLLALLVAGGPAVVVLGLPMVFGVALVVWRYVERPSITLSQSVGRAGIGLRFP